MFVLLTNLYLRRWMKLRDEETIKKDKSYSSSPALQF